MNYDIEKIQKELKQVEAKKDMREVFEDVYQYQYAIDTSQLNIPTGGLNGFNWERGREIIRLWVAELSIFAKDKVCALIGLAGISELSTETVKSIIEVISSYISPDIEESILSILIFAFLAFLQANYCSKDASGE